VHRPHTELRQTDGEGQQGDETEDRPTDFKRWRRRLDFVSTGARASARFNSKTSKRWVHQGIFAVKAEAA